ncbi:hypothetical protein AX15_002507 [Amanita polypyramis BW_CC]|nr:hypothetical protein AX15_002507 [Amanita polypyramis BW_CC]
MNLTVTTLATFTVVTLSLSLVLFAYERALVPLYGSGPTNYLLSTIVLCALLASTTRPFHIPTRRNLLFSGLVLSVAPKATYWVGALTSRRKQSIMGPAITHVVVFGPLAFLLTSFLAEVLESSDSARQASRRPLPRRLFTTIVSWWLTLLLSRRLWSQILPLRRVSESEIYLNLAFLAYSTWLLTFPSVFHLQKSKKHNAKRHETKAIVFAAFLVVWWFVQPMLTSPILPHPLPAPYNRPDYPLRIHSAVQSVTGLIIVAEVLPRREEMDVQSIRYLRASHSILGGVWMYDNIRVLDDQMPVKDSYGTFLGDSIYAAFTLQEAVRLVNSTGKTDRMREGLVIGLGAGISATAFNRHGISTTIVEIDPAVYDAARQYFGLPDPGADRVFLEDARSWVSHRRSRTGSIALFDFVVHDCFSGGGVPEHIYTLEFWNDLKELMEPEGIVVVNYAGSLRSESSRLVLRTLLKAFGQCRAFHDLMGPNEATEKRDTSFANMVIFCSGSVSPLTFRESRKSDYLGSPLRRYILTSLEDRRIDIGEILEAEGDSKSILTDQHNPLGRLQDREGHEHWRLMRRVLADGEASKPKHVQHSSSSSTPSPASEPRCPDPMTIMTTYDLHEFSFFWSGTDADRVVVTGTFDNWSKSLYLTKGSNGFSVSVKVPWSTTIVYKYIVDGRWALDESKPKRVEPEGYVNNIYVAPSKPSSPLSSMGTGAAAPLGLTGSPSSTIAQNVLEETVGIVNQAEIPDNLQPKSNGHAALDEMQQIVPSGQETKAKGSSIEEAMMFVPVDRQQVESEIAAAVGQNVAEETPDEKRQEKRLSGPASEPTKQLAERPVQATVTEPAQPAKGASKEGVSQVMAAVSPSPEESKRPESKFDETASTHKPLGPIPKPPHSPTSEATPEAAGEVDVKILATSNEPSPANEVPPTQPESAVPATSNLPPSEATSASDRIPATSYVPEGGNGVGSRSVEAPTRQTGVAPVKTPEQTKAPTSTPEGAVSTVEPPKEESAASQATASPTVTESGVAAGPAKERKPVAEIPVSSPSKTQPAATEIPKVPRESGEVQAKSPPNGTPRKRTSFIQKVKRIFTHKEKGKK